MPEPPLTKPLIERLKAYRPRRWFRRRVVQIVFFLLTLFIAAQALGAVLRLASLPTPFSP